MSVFTRVMSCLNGSGHLQQSTNTVSTKLTYYPLLPMDQMSIVTLTFSVAKSISYTRRTPYVVFFFTWVRYCLLNDLMVVVYSIWICYFEFNQISLIAPHPLHTPSYLIQHKSILSNTSPLYYIRVSRFHDWYYRIGTNQLYQGNTTTHTS